MSNTPPASNPPPATGPVAMPPRRPPLTDVLPEKAGIKAPDSSHSADGFYEAHQEANKKEVPGAMPPVTAAPITPPAAKATETPPAATPEPDEDKGSVVSRLAKKTKPTVPPAPTTTPPAGETPPLASSKNPEDEIALDPKLSAPAHESFGRIKSIATGLRDQLNASREEARQYKVRLEAAEKGTPAPEAGELDKLRAENKALSDRLALVDLQEHPKFQTEFVQPRQQALSEAAALLTANGVPGDPQSLLSKPRAEFGKAVSEMAKGLSDFDRTDFAENMRKAWTLNQQAQGALSKSKEVYTALRSRDETSQKQAFDKTWSRASQNVGEYIVELEVPTNAPPEQRTSIEQYNAAFKGLRTVAEQRAFGPAGAEAIAEHAIKSAAYDFHIQQALPRMMQEIDGLLANNRKMAAELRAIQARNPNRQLAGASTGTGGGAGPDGTLSHEQLSKMSHAEAAAALAPRR